MNKSDLIDSLDNFTAAYIKCALWSSYDQSDECGGLPLDRDYGPEDITLATLREMVSDCKAFQRDNAADLEGLDEGNSGHNFWLTRNHHGAGFWDRGLGERGKRLTEAAHAYGDVDLMVWRGKVHS